MSDIPISLEEINRLSFEAVKEIIGVANLKPKQVLVLGCSTSEIQGRHIGSFGSTEVAVSVLEGIEKALECSGIYLAVQCCEHLNRALVVENEVCERYSLTEVTVLPVPNAGGSCAAAAFNRFKHPVVVENIQAHAGIDIGDTLIGMHLRPVAVPIRLNVKLLGNAHVTAASTRPKLIGGRRGVYPSDKMTDKCVKG